MHLLFNFFRIAFSLLSNRARLLSKTRGLPVTTIDIVAKHQNLKMDILLSDAEKLPLFFKSSTDVAEVLMEKDEKKVVWRNLGFSTAECIHRILDVFNCESIQELKFYGTESFDALPILATLPPITQIFVWQECHEVFVHKMLEMLSKKISNIDMYQNRFRNLEQFQKVLMLNMNSITINVLMARDPTRFRLSLDDLVVCNAVHLHLHDTMDDVKTLNRFFKLWKRNKSNPRLEHLKFMRVGEASTDVLLKGLNVIEMPPTTTRTFRVYEDSRCREKVVTGGLDVMRLDGTRATLEVRDTAGITVVEFYVWM